MDPSDSWSSLCTIERKDQCLVEYSRIPLFQCSSNPSKKFEFISRNNHRNDCVRKIFFTNDRNFTLHKRFSLMINEQYMDIMKGYSYKYADLRLRNLMVKRRFVVPPKRKLDVRRNSDLDDFSMVKTDDDETEGQVQQFHSIKKRELKAPTRPNKDLRKKLKVRRNSDVDQFSMVKTGDVETEGQVQRFHSDKERELKAPIRPNEDLRKKLDVRKNSDVDQFSTVKTEDGETEGQVQQLLSDMESELKSIPYSNRNPSDSSIYRWSNKSKLSKECLDEDIDKYMADTKINSSNQTDEKTVDELEECPEDVENLVEFIE